MSMIVYDCYYWPYCLLPDDCDGVDWHLHFLIIIVIVRSNNLDSASWLGALQ